MDILKKTQKNPTPREFKELWNNGTFVFDTNVLLDIYRLPDASSKDLLTILHHKEVRDKIWVPFQAYLEYTYNRLTVIADQKEKFNEVNDIISKTINEINEVKNKHQEKINKLQIKKRHSVLDYDKVLLSELFKKFTDSCSELRNNIEKQYKRQPDVNNKDLLVSKINKLINGKVGECFDQKKLDEIYKEGEKRYALKRPPGFMDDDPKDEDKIKVHIYKDLELKTKFGDLILWEQIIKEINDKELQYVVFVLNDLKEDWWKIVKNKRIGLRYELLNEIYHKAPSLKLIYAYNTSTFMENAKNMFSINIKDSSIEDAKEVVENRIQRIEYENLTKLRSNAYTLKHTRHLVTFITEEVNLKNIKRILSITPHESFNYYIENNDVYHVRVIFYNLRGALSFKTYIAKQKVSIADWRLRRIYLSPNSS